MTPQQLMDLPYAGMAKRELASIGSWSHLMTDGDRIDWLAENVSQMARNTDKQSWKFKTDKEEHYDTSFFREDIDNAAADMDAQQ